MLFRKNIVSTRTLFQLTVAVVFFMVAVGAAVAANSGNPPLLVPYSITTVAGTPQVSYGATPAIISGYGGDATSTIGGGNFNGVPVLAVPVESFTGVQTGTLTPGATLNHPDGIAVDSVGNLYIADNSNALIREVNYSTGKIDTIAGYPPQKCGTVNATTLNSYTTCVAQPGCADGVPAIGSKIGASPTGLQVDSFGNVYFDDSANDTLSIVYRGGTRVADFIKRVNPNAAANGVNVGYLYHIAGSINLNSCAAASTASITDNALAFSNTALTGASAVVGANLHGPTDITLDSAGNIYIDDEGNNIMRVINTQETPQTFFQYTIAPGYMRIIVNCSALYTTACEANPTAFFGTGINGPINALNLAVGSTTNQYIGGVDPYGNLYEIGAKGWVPGTYVAVAYAGGAPLTNLLNAEVSTLSPSYSSSVVVPSSYTKYPNELPLTYGNAYDVIGNMTSSATTLPSGFLSIPAASVGGTGGTLAVRPTSLNMDTFGTLWYYDNHYPELTRIDQYTQDATSVIWSNGDRLSPSGAYGAAGSGSTVNGGKLPALSYKNSGGVTTSVVVNPPLPGAATGTSSDYSTYASLGASATSTPELNPWACVYGTSTYNGILGGPQTYDPLGDGCPAAVAYLENGSFESSSDGLGNIYLGDNGDQVVRELPLGIQFAATAVGAGLTQPIQVHFDQSNNLTPAGNTNATPGPQIPSDGPSLGYQTNAFSISPSSEFSIDTTDPEFPMGMLVSSIDNALPSATSHYAMYSGLPTCTQLGIAASDLGWDCLVYVTFNPQRPGLREAALLATTYNGSVYNFPLSGIGQGGQLAIDGGEAVPVPATGLGTTSSVAVTPAGIIYIADPLNNRIVVKSGINGAQSALSITGLSNPSTLNNPMGVAVDAAGNVYISDTGNNRVLKVSTVLPAGVTGSATVLGNNVWISGSICDNINTQAADCTFSGYSYQSPGAASPTTNYGPNGAAVTISILNEPGASVGMATVAGATLNPADPTTYTIPGIQASSGVTANYTGTTAPPQYQFNGPQGLAVDVFDNVYVADTGNKAVVEIPANINLGGATPLLQYPGAPAFVKPVAVALDTKGNIYVADQGNPSNQVVRIPAGGGDLQPGVSQNANTSALYFLTAGFTPSGGNLFGGNGISTPNGVAVDAAGDVYVSDGTGNAVWEAPAVQGSGVVPFTLNFAELGQLSTPLSLNSPAGLALDSSGNLYVADSGNNEIVYINRQTPTVDFGKVPQDTTTQIQPLCSNSTLNDGSDIGDSSSCVLTVTNIGNLAVNLATPFLSASGNSGDPFSVTTTCAGSIASGKTCTISPTFTTVNKVVSSSTYTLGTTPSGGQSISLTVGGESPQVTIALAASGTGVSGTNPSYTAPANAAPVITATVTQPNVHGDTPAGSLVFNWVIDANSTNSGVCGVGGNSATAPIGATSGSAPGTLVSPGVWSFTLPAIGQGLQFSVTATYTSSDVNDSSTTSRAITVTAPAITEQAVAPSESYTYGAVPPNPNTSATLSPLPPASISYTFTTGGASQYSAVSGSPYPIQVKFSGAGSCSYGSPTVTTTAGGSTVATVTENPITLTYSFPNPFTTLYGAANYNFNNGIVYNGLLAVDVPKIGANFTPVQTSILNVQNQTPYPVIPTVIGKPIAQGNYVVNVSKSTNGTEIVTPAPTTISVSAAKTSVLNSASGISSATFTVSVSSLVPAGQGIPSGTVTAYDYFVPITSTTFIPIPTSGFPVSSVTGGTVWPASAIPPCATGAVASTTCTPPLPAAAALSTGSAVITLPAYVAGTLSPYYTSTGAVVPGTHYLSFQYSGDAGSLGDTLGNFACSVVGQAATSTCPTTGLLPTALTVDYPDFYITSATGPVNINPGTVPSGNGLPTLPGQSSATPQSAAIVVNTLLSFSGNINLSCATPEPYIFCSVTYFSQQGAEVPVVSIASGAATQTQPFILSVWTPANLPLGYNFGSSAQLLRTGTKTSLAFIPVGILAFCVRRRRKLSRMLWMLIGITAVSMGMSGCGGNQVDFYTPIPSAALLPVTVTGTYTSSGVSIPNEARSYTVYINIQ